MNALVTGANGFIGSHLVELLLARGYSVRCLVRKSSDLTWLNGLNVQLVYGDLFNDAALRAAVAHADYVYHSAALTKAKTEDEYFRANATGVQNLLKAVREHSPSIRRFVFISSQAAVGPSKTLDPIHEETPPHPLTAYGRSKRRGEEYCLEMAHAIPITIVRPPVVYGPREKDVYAFFKTMKMGLQPMIGFKEKYVSMIHVADLVGGFLLAAESEKARGETYFITSKSVHGWREIGDLTRTALQRPAVRLRIPEAGVYAVAAVAEFLALFSPKPALINFEKARDMVQDYWTCDPSKAKKDLGFEQQIPLAEGIRQTVQWYQEHKWL